MASSKMFLNNYDDGGEWSINGWPNLSAMSGYSLETTYFVVCSSLASAVLFCLLCCICRVFSPCSLVWFLCFSFYLSTFKTMLPPCRLLVFGLTCLLSPCEKGVEAPFTFLTELCDLWAALPCAQRSTETSGVFPSCFPGKKKGGDPLSHEL